MKGRGNSLAWGKLRRANGGGGVGLAAKGGVAATRVNEVLHF